MNTSLEQENYNQQSINTLVIGIKNFQQFLHQLKAQGTNPLEILRLKNYVRYEIEKGNDPYFKPTKNGLYVDNVFFNVKTTLGLRASNQNLNNTNIDGFADQLLQSSGDPTLTAIAAIVDFDKVLGNFSAIFANGFDLSCWGSATNSQEMQTKANELATEVKSAMSQINSSNLESIINELERKLTYLHTSYERNMARRDWANCTEKGWKLYIDAVKDLKKNTIDLYLQNLKSSGYTVTSITESLPDQTLEDMYRPDVDDNNTTSEKNYNKFGPVTYKRYSISAPKTDTINNNTEISEINQSGFGPIVGIAVALLILSQLFKGKNQEENLNE